MRRASVLVLAAALGCFGSRLREAGEMEAAQGIAVEESVGLAMILAGGAGTAYFLDEDGEADFYTNLGGSILSGCVALGGTALLIHGECRDSYMLELLEAARKDPAAYARWERMKGAANAVFLVGLVALLGAPHLAWHGDEFDNDTYYFAQGAGIGCMALGVTMHVVRGSYPRTKPGGLSAFLGPGAAGVVYRF